MSHYFIENPEILTNERELTLDFQGHSFRFLTNNGLFSCNKLDDASLLLLKNMPPIQGALLDLGCGYGLLGIVLAKLNNIVLTQSDVNSLALNYAQKNSSLNNITATPIHSDSFDAISGMFDNITLNPPIHAGKETMYRMYHESTEHLHPGGSLFIVIQKKHGAESTLKKLNEIFTHCYILHKKKGYYVIQCTKA